MAEEKIRFRCPDCGKRVAAPAEKAGVRMRCPQCRKPATVPTPQQSKEPQNRFVATPLTEQSRRSSESLDDILERAAENGLLLKDAWLLLRCPSCTEWIKVRKENLERLVACGKCAYEFSVGVR